MNQRPQNSMLSNSTTNAVKKPLGFWIKLGCYAEVFFCTFLFMGSFLGMLATTISEWDKISTDLLTRLAIASGWAFITVWWVVLWNTGKNSIKKILNV